MPPSPTRTLNPLPFQDLEPHRFEDLVRGLAHGFRQWRSLEATGRGGNDDGIDIRGTEIADDGTPPEGERDDDVDPPTRGERAPERTWVFQCKREQALSAADIKKIVKACLPAPNAVQPHGFVIAAACDVTKKTRDVFRAEMVARGIGEFFVWARGELEDMLFQPHNDGLLFAFFGISLTARRRSAATSIRSRVALKRQFSKLCPEDPNPADEQPTHVILLRDPLASDYPPRTVLAKRPHTIICRFLSTKYPRGVFVVARKFLAQITPDAKHWDALTDLDIAPIHCTRTLPSGAWFKEQETVTEYPPMDYWNECVPKHAQAYLFVGGFVPFERVVAIDPIGDGLFPVPHVFVEWTSSSGPFDGGSEALWLETAGYPPRRVGPRVTQKTRRRLFPRPLPTDLWPAQPGTGVMRSLGDALATGIDAVVAKVTASPPASAPTPDPWQEAQRAHAAAFIEWRDAIAAPTMYAVAQRLRGPNQRARVVLWPPAATDGGDVTHEIEFRAELKKRSPMGHDYWSLTYLRIARSHGGRVKLERTPSRPSTSREREPDPILSVLSVEWLENELADLLQRAVADH